MSFSIVDYIIYSAAAVFVYMTLIYVIALFKKDNSIVDIAWGLGFVFIALLTFFLEKGFTFRHTLVTILVLIWGFRLAVHIFIRNRGRGEDFRYAQWRREWGKGFLLRSFFQIFMLQGLLLLVIVSPVMLVNSSKEAGTSLLDLFGLILWLFGFFFEAGGDYQLSRFKKDPQNKGKIMSSGLWKYTRHPNYFGEAVMWWGVFLIALSIPYGWTAIISPLLITFLLLRVSGVTMLEKRYAGNKEFEAYAKRTNAFFPWFPKKID
jgi:steroid 5-alpha reductase family enzyme